MKKQTRVILTVSTISIVVIALIVLLVLKFTQGTAIDLGVEACFNDGEAKCYLNQTTLSTAQDTVYSFENGKFEVQVQQPPKWAGCAGAGHSCTAHAICGCGVLRQDAYGCNLYSYYSRVNSRCTGTLSTSVSGGGSISGAGKGCTYNLILKVNGNIAYQTNGYVTTPVLNYPFTDSDLTNPNATIYSLTFGQGYASGDTCEYISGVITTSKPKILCGNGAVDSKEICDANTNACMVGDYKGIETCNAQCNGWNTCVANESYGDGIINGKEVCDGNNFAGMSCQTLGFIAGNLVCQNSGATIDNSKCSNTICGNNIIELSEVCDSDTISCQSPLIGNMTCRTDCSDYDASTCKEKSAIPLTTNVKVSLPIAIGSSVVALLLIVAIILLIVKRK